MGHDSRRGQKPAAARYQEFFSSIPIGLYRTSPSGRILEVNPALARMLGYDDPAEMLPIDVEQTYADPDERRRWLALLERDGTVRSFETRLLRRDGEPIWVRNSALVVRDETGEVLQYQGCLQDITTEQNAVRDMEKALEEARLNHEKAELALKNTRQQRARLGAVLEASADAIVTIDHRGDIQFWNPAAERLFGFPADEAIGQPLTAIIPEPAQERYREALSAASLSRQGSRLQPHREQMARHRDGTPIPVEISLSQWSIDEDRFFFTAIIRNLSPRKAAEAALRESEDLHKTIVENSGDVMIVSRSDGSIDYVSPSCSEVLGWTPAELLSQPLQNVHPDDRDAVAKQTEAALQGTGCQGFEYRVQTRTGEEHWVSHSWTPVEDHGGVSRVIGVIRNVTPRKAIEAERVRTEKLESLALLAGGIAHDFNNLLTAIIANIDLALLDVPEGSDGSESRELLKDAALASQQAGLLTHRLQTFAKGGTPLRSMGSLASVIADATQFSLSGSRSRSVVDLPDDLWSASFDAGQISQVINNLIINADQAMPQGGDIEVLARNVTIGPKENTSLPAGEYVRIDVRDCGVGIPSENLALVFDPYFSTKQAGTGLGLATSYSIIRAHGGGITVESEVGAGTCFQVWLPAVQFEVSRSDSTQVILESHEGRALVMDDEEAVRRVVGRMLRRLGYEVDTAENGEEALALLQAAALRNESFSLAVLDLTIPGGHGGREVVEALGRVDPTVDRIAMSGYSRDQILERYEEYGFDGALTKPFTVKDLQLLIREISGRDWMGSIDD